MLKIALESLGCSKNLVDAEIMMGILNNKGYKLIGDFEEADDIDIDFYKYQESLPVGLNEKTGLYEYMTFIHTNLYMDEGSVYSFEEKNIVFY